MKKQSKFLSLILRHNPAAGNLVLDEEGWAKVSDVMSAIRTRVPSFSRANLDELVATNDKKRFSFDATGMRIRANQGHSIPVDLKLTPVDPPEILYHGTKAQFLTSILEEGLKSGSRQHVHLSATLDTAHAVANRRPGTSVILKVITEGLPTKFYCSDNGVWLTDYVPASALEIESYSSPNA